jgi:hypothetical protein
MRRLVIFLLLAASTATAFATSPESCRVIHGRTRWQSADGQMFVWHIGTHHYFWILDDKSQDLIFKYISSRGDDQLYADFTVCPTVKYREGAAQFAILRKIAHPHVVKRY